MEQVLAGEVDQQASILERLSSSQISLRRIFESEEVGLFRLDLEREQRVAIGHDRLASIVLCLAGTVAVVRHGEETLTIEAGSYASIPEGQNCTIAAQGTGAQTLLFLGVDQLPGAFFNSYGPAHVQN